jgi:hypothetical protein
VFKSWGSGPMHWTDKRPIVKGSSMTWVLKIEEVCDGKIIRRQKVMTIERPSSIKTVDDIGLRSNDAKRLLSAVQQFVATS